jgi:hypothetical protein
MVYFITAPSGFVKIGFTDRPIEKRLKSMQTGSWEPLAVALVLMGGRKQEREYHRRFKKWHVHGEWFRMGDEIKDFLSPRRRELLKELRDMHTVQYGQEAPF